MKNKKNLAIASLVLSLLSLIPFVVAPESAIGIVIFASIGAVVAIMAIVFGSIAKKEVKGFSLAGMIIGIISCFLLIIVIFSYAMIIKATDCIDNGNGTSNCTFFGEELNGVPNESLTEDQMKKGE